MIDLKRHFGLPAWIGSGIIMFTCSFCMLAIPAFVREQEWRLQQGSNEVHYEQVYESGLDRHYAIQKIARITLNMRVSYRELLDIVAKYSIAAYPDRSSAVAGTVTYRLDSTIPNIMSVMVQQMFLMRMQSVFCTSLSCKLFIGASTALTAILTVSILGSMVVLYRNVLLTFIGPLFMRKTEKKGKSLMERNYRRKLIQQELFLLTVTCCIALIMFAVASFIHSKENEWTWQMSVEYTFHIASGLGHTTNIPYYIKNNEVTYMRAMYLVAMLLWATFPVAAICCSAIRAVMTTASMANSEMSGRELDQHVAAEDMKRKAREHRPLYH